MEYIIVGDTEKYKGCLIFTCGESKEFAETVLNKLLTDPDDSEKKAMEGLTNIRIKEEKEEDCWWKQGHLD